jgi:DNA polymerase (family X)
MDMDNRGIASFLSELAVYSELAGENPFKARAFQNVARAIEKHALSIETLIAEGRVHEIKGIGPSIEEMITEAIATGTCKALEDLKAKFPPGITDMLSLSGMGPKKVKAVYDALGISTIGELEYACRENRLASLSGFGEKTQANVLKAIEFRKTTQAQRLFSDAIAIGDSLVAAVTATNLFARIDIAGSLRRGKSTFKDIDILLMAKPDVDSATIRGALVALADAERDGPAVIGAGDTKVSIRREGLPVDFRIVPEESYPAALQHFTGSKEHNTLLRSRAKAMGMKMSEWGVFDATGAAIPLKDEKDAYAAVGLAWIPPEIREADGEIEAAEAGTLPTLVEEKDFRGMIHVHTSASDGARSLEEMARECIRRGYSWLALSDHSRSAAYAGGLSSERLLAQVDDIRALNVSLTPFRIFAGIESDILADGGLDYPDEVLAKLDFVIGSVHSKLTMDPAAATARLLAAAKNPHLTILGHPSGRLLLSREGYQWDENAIVDALAARGAALEHNCNPHRLDPDWGVLKRAARMGVRIAIDPDAHEISGYDDMRFGITMARKAWLTRADILNCMETEEIDAWFTARKKA